MFDVLFRVLLGFLLGFFLGFLRGVEQAVEMHDEIAHMRVVDGLLRLGFPGDMRGRVIGIDADDLDLIEILERVVFEIDQLAADDEVKQLLRSTIWHDWFPK